MASSIMRSTAVVKDNRKRWDTMTKNMGRASELDILAGIFGDTHSDEVKKGTQNEFGTARIPERSFLRSTLKENEQKIFARMSRLYRSAFAGNMSIERAYQIIGLEFVGMVQRKIRGGIAPANSSATIRRKKSSKTLIDTGRMIKSITHKVVRAK